MPKISVVIPAYNEEKYLTVSLKSFKNQTFKDFELIVADGGSTDDTEKISSIYNAKFITVKNSNVVRARDAGLRAAQGEILVCADADTFYPPDHLEVIWNEYLKNDQVVAVTGKARMVNGPKWGIIVWGIIYRIIALFYRLFATVLYAPAYNLSYKRLVFLDLGGYDVSLDFGGDELDVLSRLKKVGKIAFTNKLCPQTDGRRYKVGFFTFLFKHALYYYTLNYLLARFFRKSLIRAKPVR
ncbi:hypothetical protein A2W14_04705 [Candidatus Gottesmanbacteria bacterium RBG_16_37_8]|uniref:Glycosyltransferase 2-like domain-containing protein n=1 Tax=Candidatus Gottesmanbacteria bacterium RBG_16_37_8 TaxID=1798371 RepID=A0A1F5YUL9_9BACT|nr:MAG: hypothetical protein A2W14_04705 [Candidatus Gottesmanbacteria bacterium RBG_16_37_8]